MFIFYTIMLLAFFSPGLMVFNMAQIWATDIPLLLVFAWRIFSPPRIPLQYKSYMMRNLLFSIFIFTIWLTFVTILTLPASQHIPVPFALFSLVGRFRPVLFLLFCAPYAWDSKKLRKLFNFLIVLFVLQFVGLFCQKYSIAGINYWYTPKFRPVDVNIAHYLLSGHRTIGSIGNPNSLGTFMSIFAVLCYSVYAFGKGLSRWIGLTVTFLTFIICIFYAGTRQGTLSIILGCALVSVIALFLGKIGRLSFVIILLFLLNPFFCIICCKALI